MRGTHFRPQLFTIAHTHTLRSYLFLNLFERRGSTVRSPNSAGCGGRTGHALSVDDISVGLVYLPCDPDPNVQDLMCF